MQPLFHLVSSLNRRLLLWSGHIYVVSFTVIESVNQREQLVSMCVTKKEKNTESLSNFRNVVLAISNLTDLRNLLVKTEAAQAG